MMSHPTAAAIAATIAIVSLLDVVSSGGSCQSYGHSCLGGHGKRSKEQPPSAQHLLLKQALRAKEGMPMFDFRVPESKQYDFWKRLSDKLKNLETDLNEMKTK